MVAVTSHKNTGVTMEQTEDLVIHAHSQWINKTQRNRKGGERANSDIHYVYYYGRNIL